MSYLIAIEGVDGSGKSTQAKLLSRYLQSRGINAVCIQPIYEIVDRIPVKITDKLSPRQSKTGTQSRHNWCKPVLAITGIGYALLTLALIRIAYRGKVVICDRYFYQMFFDLYGERARKIAVLFPKPDAIIVLDVEFETAIKRLDDFDASIDKTYFQKVVSYYRFIAELDDARHIQADGNVQNIQTNLREMVDFPEK